MFKYTPMFSGGKEPVIEEQDVYRTIIPFDSITENNRQEAVNTSNTQLTERQRRIYEIINNVPINVPINVPSLATILNVSEKTVKRDLYVLRDIGLIQFVGSNKTGHWEAI